MELNNKYLIMASTEKQISKSWKEYTESVARNFENFVNQINLMLTSLSESQIINQNTYIEDRKSVADGFFTTQRLNPNAQVFLNKGTITYHELFNTIYDNYYRGEEFEVNFELPQHLYSTNEDLFEEVNASFHAIIVDNAIANAYDNAESITDRITVARDYMAEKFTSAFIDSSGYLTSRMSYLKNGSSIIDIIKQGMDDSGINAIANDDIFIPSDSKAYKYTGATPTSAYCWDTVGATIASTYKAACSAVRTVISGIVDIGSKLLSRVGSYLYKTIANPIDLEKLDNGNAGNNTIEDFYIYSEGSLNLARPSNGKIKLLEKLKDGPMHMDFVTGEVMISTSYSKGTSIDKALKAINNTSILELMQQIALVTQYNTDVTQIHDIEFWNYIITYINDTNRYDQNIPLVSETKTIQEILRKIIFVTYEHFTDGSVDDIYGRGDILGNMRNVWALFHPIVLETCIKPKPIKYSSYRWIWSEFEYIDVTAVQNGNSINFAKINPYSVFDKLFSTPIEYASLNDANEELELYNSFILGRHLTQLLLYSAYTSEVYGDGRGPEFYCPLIDTATTNPSGKLSESILGNVVYDQTTMRSWATDNPTYLSSSVGYTVEYRAPGATVSNKDFVNAATGIECAEYDISNVQPLSDENSYISIFTLPVYSILWLQFDEQINNPLGYTFLPYDTRTSNFYPSSYRIKTDKQNIDAFNQFLTTAVVVAVIAITATALVLKLRKASRVAQLQFQGLQTQLANKLANGTATAEDMKLYNKAKRKSRLLNALTGNMTQAVSEATASTNALSSVTANESTIDISPIIRVITGE